MRKRVCCRGKETAKAATSGAGGQSNKKEVITVGYRTSEQIEASVEVSVFYAEEREADIECYSFVRFGSAGMGAWVSSYGRAAFGGDDLPHRRESSGSTEQTASSDKVVSAEIPSAQPETPYTAEYNPFVDLAADEQDSNVCPATKDTIADLELNATVIKNTFGNVWKAV